MLTTHAAGRGFIIRWEKAIDGSDPTIEKVAEETVRRGAKFIVFDASRAPCIDSAGLRWMLGLRARAEAAGVVLRIVARPGSKVARNLNLLNMDLDIFPSAVEAWQAAGRRVLLRQNAQIVREDSRREHEAETGTAHHDAL